MMDPPPKIISDLGDKVAALAKDVAASDDSANKKLQTRALVLEAKKLISQVQDPGDAIMDYINTVSMISAVRALSGIGVFDAIPPAGSATAKQIAEKCAADEELIIRLMRQLKTAHMFDEISLSEWTHNRSSIGLSSHYGAAGQSLFNVAMTELLRPIFSLSEYLKQFGNKDVLTYTDTPHSWYNSQLGKNYWQVISSEPGRAEAFMQGLSLFEALHPVIALYPFADNLAHGNAEDRVLAVDIGGGRGTAMLELRAKCPHLKGNLVLQDLAPMLEQVKDEDLPGITKMPHDFFTEQPVKGAQMYYIRRVMHDWQDKEASLILSSIKPAMAPDSRIIISDMALAEPASAADAGAFWMDLMMLSIGGKERTKRDWQKLADMAGLKLVQVWQEPQKFGPICVVEYMLPDGV